MEPTKRPVQGELVKLLFHQRTDRGMTLLPFETRCVRAGEIHELVSTDQDRARAGDRIDRVGFLGFAEVGIGGVIERGDEFLIGDRLVGLVLGFDGCHHPNHYNVLIAVAELVTAAELGLAVGQLVCFQPAPGRSLAT